MDTIKIKIPCLRKYVCGKYHFSQAQSKYKIDENGRYKYTEIYTNNIWRKQEKKKGKYIPKYCLVYSNYYQETSSLVIEFSVGKFLNGESITPIKDGDMGRVVNKLHNFINTLGLNNLNKQDIENASVHTFACKKDIEMDFDCLSVISELSMVNFRSFATKDFYYTDYNKNAGSSVYFGNKSIKFVVYDKLAEIRQRVDRTKEEERMLVAWKDKYLLRFEFTLKKPNTFISKWSKYGVDDPKFKDVFCEKVWMSILRSEVERVYNRPINMLVYKTYSDRFLQKVINSKTIKPSKKGKILYILMLIQQKGLSQARQQINNEYSSRQTWYNTVKIIEKMLGVKAGKIRKKTLNPKKMLESIFSSFGIVSRL